MHDKRSWFLQLKKAERIPLTGPKYFKRIRIFLTLFIVGSLLAIVGLYAVLGVSYAWILSSLVIAVGGYAMVTFCSKHLFSSSVKGGTLILSDIKHRNHITSLRSLKSVRSKRLGTVQLTQIQFKLDGIVRKGMIINSDQHIPFNTDRFILKALDLYKKQKANL